MAKKNNIRAQVKELTDRLADGVKELYTSEKYMKYLRTMARFHTYSTRNTMLIHMQKPDATYVAGFRTWQNKFSRNVKKGEKGIRILAPAPHTFKREEQKLDPVTQAPVIGVDGLPETEEIEVHIPRFKVISVFDVSQTDGKPLPALAEDLTGDVQHFGLFMDALKAVSPLPIKMEALPPNTDGVCRFGDSIGLREGMSEIQTISAAVHEVAHATLHDMTITQELDKEPEVKDKATKEVEAESVSYAVCAYYGIETSPNSFGYLATWSSGKDLKELNASLDVIRKTSAALIEGIDREFHRLAKEHGITLAHAVETDELKPGADAPQPAMEAEHSDQVIQSAFERLEEGDLVFLPNATSPLQFVQTRDDDVLFVAPEFGLDVTQTHEQVRQALRMNEGNRHLLAAAEAAVQSEHSPDKQYELGYGHLGNGITVWNRLEEKDGDYVTIAHINEARSVTFYDPDMPQSVREQIESEARTSDMTISATQDTPVFSTPAGGLEPESAADMPDPAIGLSERDLYGYTKDNMLPMTKARALELFDYDYTVYLLRPDNTEELIYERSEIEDSDSIFGLESTDWLGSPEYYAARVQRAEAVPLHADAKEQPLPDPAAADVPVIEPTVHEKLDAVLYKWKGPDLDGLAPRAIASALIEWQQSNGTPLGEQEADLLMEYAVVTEDVRLTKDLAENLGRAGFERDFDRVNPAVERDVRDELALWETQDPIFLLARDINQYFNDIDLYGYSRDFTRYHDRALYQELLNGTTSRTVSWLRAHNEPTRVESATALADRIDALDFDTPYKLAEDIHAFIEGEVGTSSQQKDIYNTFIALRDMDEEAVGTLEIALRASVEAVQNTDKRVPAELLDRLNALKIKMLAVCVGVPMVKVTFTESMHLIRDQMLPLSVADELYGKLDAELHGKQQGYDKTDFSIFYIRESRLQQYNGHFNIGDGEGSLIDHIRSYAEQTLSDADKAAEHEACREVHNHLVPYLMLHCSMAQREKEETAFLQDHIQHQDVNDWHLIQAARLRDYVRTCRLMLNTKPDDTPFPRLPMPHEIDAMGEQVAHMPLSEAAKDYVLQNCRCKSFAIYQLKTGDDLHYHRFSSLEQLHKEGNTVERGNYEMVYMSLMDDGDEIESIIRKFDFDFHPPHDFTGHSLSTSDILVFNLDGDISTYYLNGYSVIELPHFIGCERNLSARLAEDIDAFLFDYGRQGKFGEIVNDRLVTSSEELQAAIEDGGQEIADIREMIDFVCGHDTDKMSEAASLMSRLEAYNPPRNDDFAYKAILPDEITVFDAKDSIYQGMVTFFDKAGNVYLGQGNHVRHSAYNPTIFDNRDKSLYFVSDSTIHHGMLAGTARGEITESDKAYMERYQAKLPSSFQLVNETAHEAPKPSLRAQLQERQKSVSQGRDEPKIAPNHNTDREV